jgi:lauroyl/myristoyl acyltransferase
MFFREILGVICILLFWLVQRAPYFILVGIFTRLLPLYLLIRKKNSHRIFLGIHAYWKHQDASRVHTPLLSEKEILLEYYTTRFQLFCKHLQYYRQKQQFLTSPRIQGVEHIEKALIESKPILLLGLHMGIFEALHTFPWLHYLEDHSKDNNTNILNSSLTNRTLSVLTAPAFSKTLSTYMTYLRMSPNSNINPSIEKRSIHPHQLSSHLKECIKTKGIFAYMGDQASQGTEYVTLWNTIKLPMSTRLPQFFKKHGGMVLPICTYEKKSGTEIHCYPPLTVEENNSEAWQKTIEPFLEKSIALAPYQWNWSYPSWSLKKT